MRFLLQRIGINNWIKELNFTILFVGIEVKYSNEMMQNSRRSSLDLLDAYSIYVGLPYIITPAANCIGSVLFTSPSLVYRRLHKIIYTPTTWYMLCSMHKYVIVLFFSKIKLIILRHGWYICFSNYSTVTGNKTKTEEH